jgi:hypothetical protein
MVVMDISWPSQPRLVGYYDTPGWVTRVAVAGDYAYVIDHDSGLLVISVADPANPVEVGFCATPGEPRGMAVVGDYAYVAAYEAGLLVISVADPANPVEVGFCATPGGPWDVALAGRYAYVAAGEAGLRVIDVSDPAAPVEVAYWDTPGRAHDVAVVDGYAYLTDYLWGMFVFRALSFDDVGVGHWALWEIEACVAAGIVAGRYDGLYHPEGSVTRAEMAVFISRALAGGDENVPDFVGTPSFRDVNRWHWASDYVEYAVSQSVVAGYGDGLYHPEYEVTRDQMAVYVARALVAPEGEAGLADYVPADPRDFPDVASDFWAYKHIEYCVENGVVQGYEDGYYHPGVVVTRDQMAVYVARAFGLVP